MATMLYSPGSCRFPAPSACITVRLFRPTKYAHLIDGQRRLARRKVGFACLELSPLQKWRWGISTPAQSPLRVCRCHNVVMKMAHSIMFREHQRFRECRQAFQCLGVRDLSPAGVSLPRQHSMVRYRRNIKNFGASNRLCSSITESKHIPVAKRPWHCSSRYNAIHRIMETNQRAGKPVLLSPYTECLIFPPGDPAPPAQVHQTTTAIDLTPPTRERFATKFSLPKPTVCQSFSLCSQCSARHGSPVPNYPNSLHGLGYRVGHPSLPDPVRTVCGL